MTVSGLNLLEQSCFFAFKMITDQYVNICHFGYALSQEHSYGVNTGGEQTGCEVWESCHSKIFKNSPTFKPRRARTLLRLCWFIIIFTVINIIIMTAKMEWAKNTLPYNWKWCAMKCLLRNMSPIRLIVALYLKPNIQCRKGHAPHTI